MSHSNNQQDQSTGILATRAIVAARHFLIIVTISIGAVIATTFLGGMSSVLSISSQRSALHRSASGNWLVGYWKDGTSLIISATPLRNESSLLSTVAPSKLPATVVAWDSLLGAYFSPQPGAPAKFVEAKGWPFAAFVCEYEYVTINNSWVMDGGIALPSDHRTIGDKRTKLVRSIPFRPLWHGLLLDTCFFGMLFTMIYFATLAWMRNRLRRVGRCVTCGYDVRGNCTRCPECGTPVA